MRAEATAHLAAHDSRGALLMSLGGNHYKHSRRSWLAQTAVFLILCHHKIRAYSPPRSRLRRNLEAPDRVQQDHHHRDPDRVPECADSGVLINPTRDFLSA